MVCSVDSCVKAVGSGHAELLQGLSTEAGEKCGLSLGAAGKAFLVTTDSLTSFSRFLRVVPLRTCPRWPAYQRAQRKEGSGRDGSECAWNLKDAVVRFGGESFWIGDL